MKRILSKLASVLAGFAGGAAIYVAIAAWFGSPLLGAVVGCCVVTYLDSAWSSELMREESRRELQKHIIWMRHAITCEKGNGFLALSVARGQLVGQGYGLTRGAGPDYVARLRQAREQIDKALESENEIMISAHALRAGALTLAAYDVAPCSVEADGWHKEE